MVEQINFTPVVTKSDRQSKSSRPSIVLAFFSCLAWLYVAGRLWQDADNRTLLATTTTLLMNNNNNNKRHKAPTVAHKLSVFGCKDLERRIVETEMELTLAKSQGFLQDQTTGSTSSGKKLMAVIGVCTSFGSRLNRIVVRGSWMPKGDALYRLEERGVVIRFVIGRSPNRGDSLDRIIDEENHVTEDFLILDGHVESGDELPKKAKYFFSTAVQIWDADFYVKVDDNIAIDLGGLIELLQSHRAQDSAYIGCMKSGDVEVDKYFRHADGSLFILSKSLAQYIYVNSAFLKTLTSDETSVGSWMMGIQATYIDDSRLCCTNPIQDKVCSLASRRKWGG